MPVAKSSKKNDKKNFQFSKLVNNFKKRFGNLAMPIALTAFSFIIFLIAYELFLTDKYTPQTFIGDTNVTFLTRAQATQVLQAKFNQRIKQKLSLGSQNFIIDLATSSAKIDYSIIEFAFDKGHQGTSVEKLLIQLKTLFKKSVFTPKVSFNLKAQIEPIAQSVYKEPIDAQIIFSETTTREGTPSANIQVKEGVDGEELDKDSLEQNIRQYLIGGSFNTKLPLKSIPPKITTKHAKRAKDALETSKNEPVVLSFNNNTWTIDTKQLLTILDLTRGQDFLLDRDKTIIFLQNIASEIDIPVQEGQFDFNPETKRVSAFTPSQEGRKLDIEKTFSLLTATYLGEISKNISLPVVTTKPKIITADINNLGIKELLGQGISYFAGSIANRIYNIGLAASRINGVLIAPGEVFSFNQAVGDITAATGFKPAYVIKEGRTVLDDGGGVCQVSTTLFRAVLNAGLPVTKRTAHAYRVGYYEQGFPPGLDATVYYPSVDFQFKNDTGNHILVQAYVSGTGLYISLYGTPDGRVSTLTTPVVKNQTPPPPELRQDDPTLPKGTVKQVDWAAWGANVTFSRTVTRGDETLIQETWYSNYRPWQAVFLVGTQ